MRKIAKGWQLALLAVLLVALTGCGGGLSQTISIERETLQSKVAEYFPMSSDDLDDAKNLPMRFRLTDPEVVLAGDSDAMGLRLKVIAEVVDKNPPSLLDGPSAGPGPPRLPGSDPGKSSASETQGSEVAAGMKPPRVVEGTVSITGEIHYKAESASFYYLNSRISELSFPQLPSQFESPVREAATALLGKYFNENSIYTLSEDDLKGRAARAALKSVSVSEGKIDVELGW